jgi:hypothetical protein
MQPPQVPVTQPEVVQRRSAYQALEPVVRPAHWGVDLDRARRPGVPKERPPAPWPHARFPPAPQRGRPSAPLHGRPNKSMPPVFGTAVPLRGLSGLVRRLGYRYPDHHPRHWLLELVGDRIDSFSHRARRLAPWALAAGVTVAVLRRVRG